VESSMHGVGPVGERVATLLTAVVIGEKSILAVRPTRRGHEHMIRTAAVKRYSPTQRPPPGSPSSAEEPRGVQDDPAVLAQCDGHRT
jgi:hypothetical protein